MCGDCYSTKFNTSFDNFRIHQTPDGSDIEGTIRTGPSNWREKLLQTALNLELAEKCAEIVDEAFHLLAPLLQLGTAAKLYEHLDDLHAGAHAVEHTLHHFCILIPIGRLAVGNYLVRDERNHVNYIKTAGNVANTVSQIFSFCAFLDEVDLLPLGRFKVITKAIIPLNLLGYTIWTAALLWERVQHKHDHSHAPANDAQNDCCSGGEKTGCCSKEEKNHFWKSNFVINLTGALYDAFTIASEQGLFLGYTMVTNRLHALVGVVHAVAIVLRLMPQTEFHIEGKIKIS